MNARFPSAPRWTEDGWLESENRSLEKELRHIRNVNSSLLQGALEKWAELWAEFQDGVVAGVMVLPEAQKGFKPRCGWPEFLEKMWQLKYYLDSAKRFCEQRP